MMIRSNYHVKMKLEPLVLLQCSTPSRHMLMCSFKDIKAQEQINDGMLTVLLHDIYGWNYVDYDNICIYMELYGDKLFGGVYNVTNHKKLTRKLLSSRHGGGTYIYTREQWERVEDIFLDRIHESIMEEHKK